MKFVKILFFILIYAMLIGGFMGIIKGLVPDEEWLSFRYLLGMGGTFKEADIPFYAFIYGIAMSILEIISSILILTKNRNGIKFAFITICINTLGCMISFILGDVVAIGSIFIRLVALYVLIKVKRLQEE